MSSPVAASPGARSPSLFSTVEVTLVILSEYFPPVFLSIISPTLPS
ncbi:MAG: hypothetical protein R2710_08930 [Acidimicrobiales bacterium]